MAQNESSKTDVLLANPAPLGLMAFGMTTTMLNLSNAGAIPLDSVILSLGLLFGGLAQVIAGAFEFRKGNTFGMTAFLSYGFFWICMVFILSPAHLFGTAIGTAYVSTTTSLAAFLFLWGVFSFFMFLGTLRINGALVFVFGTLFILFFLLAAGFGWGNSDLLKFAGYEGILCGLSAMYTSAAHILNEVYKKTVFPIFPMGTKS